MRDNQYTIDGRIRFSEVIIPEELPCRESQIIFRTAVHSSQKIWDLESNTAAKKSGHGSCHLGR